MNQSTIALSDLPRSSTKRQHQVLVLAGEKRGMDLAEVRRLVGGSLTALSAAKASAWIQQLTGRGLPNPPGQKPSPYPRRRHRPLPRGERRDRGGSVQEGSRVLRLITADHIEQIGRLMLRYFDNNVAAASAWFEKNWKCQEPAQLGTIERAGEVIRVLKDMVKRKGSAK